VRIPRLPLILRSTGFRFALLHTLIFVGSVCVIAWVANVTVTSALESQARERVVAVTATLVSEYQQSGLGGLTAAVRERLSSVKRRLFYAILDPDGRTVAGDGFLAQFAGTADTGSAPIKRSAGASETGMILVVTRGLADGLRLVVADNLDSVEDVQEVLLTAFLVALVLAVLLGLAAGALFTGSLLRRVDGITRTAEAIIGGDLSRRIALAGSGDDFDRLSATLNAMLDRIGDLLENLRQISNDIAHDLRTPLGRLRQGLEDAKIRATSQSDYERAIDHAIEEADGLLDTFSALLRIAQVEAGAQHAAFRMVDLSDVLRTVAEAYGPVAEDAHRSLETDIAEAIAITGDRELLVQLFANLIENALAHTPQRTRILMRLSAGRHGAVAEVSDDGPGIPEKERDRVFQRFYRLERSRTTSGNGLGLPLVAAIVNLHGGKIELADNKPGLKVVIVFASGDNRDGT
jgi:signal transduction histidine kinase